MNTMTVDKVIDAEIIEVLDEASAKHLDMRIRLVYRSIDSGLTRLTEMVQQAKRGQIHVALGFASWTAYVADVFTVSGRLPVEQRREVVGYLSGEGMSQRAIAEVVGVGVGTVNRGLAESPVPTGTPERVTGLDDKTYPAKREPRAEIVVSDDPPAEPVEPRRHGNSTKQVKFLEHMEPLIHAAAEALEAEFTGTFDKKCTPEIAHSAAKNMRADVARINKVLSVLEGHKLTE